MGTVNATDYGPGGVKLTLPYWSPYDLLGYFLGLLGPAPQEATKETYFLPLTAVYGIWCSKIAGHAPKRFKWKPPGKGSGDWPYMFQCTWYKEKDKASRIAFRLGSCMGGDEFNENQVGSWRHTVGVRRFRILLSARLRIIMAEEEKNFPSPANYRAMERNANGTTTAYGNCAETYPFRGLMDRYVRLPVPIISPASSLQFSPPSIVPCVLILIHLCFSSFESCPVTNLSNLHGLALQRDFIQTSRNNPAYDDSEDGVVWKRIRGPCGNCRVLLQRAGAKLTNFEDLEPENAPQNSPAMEKGDGASASVPGENVSAVAAGRKSSSGDENGYIN